MKITALSNDLQARHHEATARADELRDQIKQFTAALAEAEAPLADGTDGFNAHPGLPSTTSTPVLLARLAPASWPRPLLAAPCCPGMLARTHTVHPMNHPGTRAREVA
ncbi:hypothetical protein [Streptomyces sp. NPDC002402]